jgi:sodium/bile acid cotransporter 7
MLRALKNRWFLAALAMLLAAGIFGHAALEGFTAKIPVDPLVASVLFVMALSLAPGALGSTMRRPTAPLLAIGINLALLPPLGWFFGRLLPLDLADGLAVAASVPCTLGSAAVMTRRAGGNDSIALVVTMVTNLACFIVTPAWVQLLTGRTGGPQQSFAELVLKLAMLVLAPIVAGQALHRIPRVGAWATRHRTPLGVYAQLGILTMVLVGAVKCGEQIASLGSRLSSLSGQIGLMLVLTTVLHLTAWACGWWAAGRVGLPRKDQAAVAFAGSQKTLMIGLAIAVEFGGLAVLPMMAYHVGQLLVDTLLADRLRAGEIALTPISQIAADESALG